MESKKSHSINVIETPFSTVTSGGHWFFATRDTVEEYAPGLLKKHSFDELVIKAVTWINSADSLAMILYLALAFFINPWIAAAIAFLYHYWWYHNKSAFMSIPFTPILSLLNKDFMQLLVAAVALSFMGIWEMYIAVALGILLFFLFKIGLLRRLWDKLDKSEEKGRLPLNDRVLKMVLVRYAMKEDISVPEVDKLEDHVVQAVVEYNKKKKKDKDKQ